jgi:hypothetical protein
MSIGGSEKEFILSMFLMKHKEVLEKVLDFDLDKNIILEMPHGRSKVDMLGVDEDRRVEIFIENQIKPSDRKHLMEKILPRIDDICEGCIVWIASSFHKEHLVIVKQHIQRSRHKYINFYAIEFNEMVLEHIEKLNNLYKLDIVSNLSSINDQDSPLSLVYKYEQMPKTHIGKAFIGKRFLDLERSEDVNEYMLDELRGILPEFINLLKAKKINKHHFVVSLGAGKQGVSYRISAGRRGHSAFAELFFDLSQKEIFERFKTHKLEIKREIHNDIMMHKNRRIGIYFQPDPDLDITISRIGEILSKMLSYFSPYLYGREVLSLFSDEEDAKRELQVGEDVAGYLL